MEQHRARFMEKVQKDGPGGCWLWMGTRDKRGYGVFTADGPNYSRAHRVAYQLEHGPIASSQFVCHRCDNPPCVNPAHLFLGTVHDNNRDMVAKGRHAKGETHGCAKLTAHHAEVIRRLTDWGVLTQRFWAPFFGVSRATVSHIHNRRKWAPTREA